MNELKVVLEKELGYGSCGRVYLARAAPIGVGGNSVSECAFVAVKKSRASLRLKRTLLQHEARVLLRLQGHPAIPTVFGHGRLEHFEYLAMERLGQDVEDVATKLTSKEERCRWVAGMAAQMLSALSHIHSLGLAHRDIKPGNILTRPEDSSKICVIDWGAAKPYHSAKEKEPKESAFVFGTLSYASLNAHNGQDLTRRDDLISLGYTLLSLLRSSLPWDIPSTFYAPDVSIKRQVCEKKRNWPAARLCKGFPNVFRDFLAEALPLKFCDSINYQIWQDAFFEVVTAPPSFIAELPEAEESRRAGPATFGPSKPVVHPGQFVCARLMPQLCIEGFAIQDGDPSFWHDPSISDSKFSTSTLPAVVLKVSNDELDSYCEVTLAALSKVEPKGEMVESAALLQPQGRVCEILDGSQDQKMVQVPGIPWLANEKVWCYAYPQPFPIFCNPEQIDPVPSSWNLDSDVVSKLLEILPTFDGQEGLLSSNPDIVKFTELQQASDGWAFAHLSPLKPDDIVSEGNPSDPSEMMINWQSRRGWFDDLVDLCQARKRHANHPSLIKHRGNNVKRREVDDSYEGKVMFNDWSYLQSERDTELTLGEGETAEVEGELLKIIEVTGDPM